MKKWLTNYWIYSNKKNYYFSKILRNWKSLRLQKPRGNQYTKLSGNSTHEIDEIPLSTSLTGTLNKILNSKIDY